MKIDEYGNVKLNNGQDATLSGFSLSCGARNDDAIALTVEVVKRYNCHDELVEENARLQVGWEKALSISFDYGEKNDKLKEANKELVEALEAVMSELICVDREDSWTYKQADRVLKKAKG